MMTFTRKSTSDKNRHKKKIAESYRELLPISGSILAIHQPSLSRLHPLAIESDIDVGKSRRSDRDSIVGLRDELESFVTARAELAIDSPSTSVCERVNAGAV